MRKFIVGGLVTALAALVLAPTALASSHHPTGEFANFGECPLNNAEVTNCVFSVSSGGAFTIGTKTVPLVNPVTLQGGTKGTGESTVFFGAENGETLSKTRQPVPGGLLGIVAPKSWPIWIQNWFNNLINEGLTGVSATVELAGPASGIKLNTANLLARKGTALGLPTKIHLENAILGSSCYIGSDSSPVPIEFTTGTSGALEGVVGTVKFNEAFTLVTIEGGKLVNGTFSAPAASGCGGIFSFLIDPLVNSILGLPAGSGSNSATLEGVLQSGQAKAVKASE